MILDGRSPSGESGERAAQNPAELATLMLRKSTHAAAVVALDRIWNSPNVTIIHPDESAVSAAKTQFEQYDDHTISFVDHLSVTLADERGVEHHFTFDGRDFQTLGFTIVPEDVRVPDVE